MGGTNHAFVWLPEADLGLSAGINDLGVLGVPPFNRNSVGRGISEVGRIVGRSSIDLGGVNHAFLWLPPGAVPPGLQEGMNDLGTLGGPGRHSDAWAINNHDPFQIVGWSLRDDFCLADVSFIRRAFRWDSADQEMVDLGTTVGLASSEAFDINTPPPNEIQLIAGAGLTCPGSSCPFLAKRAVAWINSVAQALPQPAQFGDLEGEARGVNNAGQLVGVASDESNDCLKRALLWQPPGFGTVNLHVEAGLPPEQETVAEAININQQVVGFNDTTDRAVLWVPDGGGGWMYRELNDLISPTCNWDLRVARDINDADGSIVGWGFHDGARRAFLLTPIETCLWDLNGDGEVDILDLLALLAAWGPCDPGDICTADFDCSGDVGILDLLALLGAWGDCPPSFGTVEPPQTVQDCIDKFCCDESRILALEKCLCAIEPENCE